MRAGGTTKSCARACWKRRGRSRSGDTGACRPGVTRATQEWALDFVHDAAESGRKFRVLSVIDVYTRECLTLEADSGFPSRRVTRELEKIVAERGAPEAIRCDNGPEFTSRHFLAWALERKIELVHIEPGRPVQNAFVESFRGKLRDECLNASWFGNLFEGTEEDRGVERGVQRRTATQQPGVPNAAGVRASHCGAQEAVGDRSAAMRRTERGTSHEFRRFKRRMIPCAKNWGRSPAVDFRTLTHLHPTHTTPIPIRQFFEDVTTIGTYGEIGRA